MTCPAMMLLSIIAVHVLLHSQADAVEVDPARNQFPTLNIRLGNSSQCQGRGSRPWRLAAPDAYWESGWRGGCELEPV